MSPQTRRDAVRTLVTERVGVTRACGLVGISRSLFHYESCRRITKPGRDIVVPVLGRIRVPARGGTQLQAQRHSSTLGVLQARAELGSEVVHMRVLGSFAAVEPLHDELIQALLSLVLRTNSVGGTRQQILL